MTLLPKRPPRKSRAQQTLEFACLYAQDNSGVTPSSEDIASELGVSQQRAYYLLNRLTILKKIEWVSKHKYKIVNSTWDPPPDVGI